MKIEVSIIIPLAPNDLLSEEFKHQLLTFPEHWEILICTSKEPDDDIFINNNFRWLPTSGGRASSLNEGARYSKGEYLWFLHSDSSLVSGTCIKLQRAMKQKEKQLFYFDLKFIRLSSHNVKPKELGVLFRSRILKTPFGDQGFFMRKELFSQYGPYSTEALYGEDHLFVRKLKRSHIKITPIGLELYTSPRKYERGGWTKITLLHQYLWIRQSLEDWWRYRRVKENEYSNRSVL